MKLTKKSQIFVLIVFAAEALEGPLNNLAALFSVQILEQAQVGSGQGMIRAAGLTLALYLGVSLQSMLTSWLRNRLFAAETVSLRDAMLHSILHRPARLVRRESDAYYLNLFNTDVETYRTDYMANRLYLFNELMWILSAAGSLFFLNPWLCVAAVVSSVIPFAFQKVFTRWVAKAKNQYSKASEVYNGVLKETLEGYEAIHADNHPAAAQERFHAANLGREKARTHANMVSSVDMAYFRFITNMSTIVCLILGGYLVLQGRLSAPMMIAAQFFFTNLAGAVGVLQDYIVQIKATKDIRAKLAREVNEPADTGTAVCGPTAPATVAYEGLSFSFGDRQLYENLSCAFAPGGCYAILGESGSGKSTLTKLLLKYYDDYQGKITLAGQDIRELSEEEIYRVVGLVSQSPFLFNASLYENITMFTGTPGKDSEEYKKLLSDLNLTALAQRVGDSPLGDFGDNISGGERQRINIARALRSHPSILIFDEPTTGLDPENVALIDQFIFARKDVTRIVITHNWSEEYLARFDAVLRIGEKSPAVLPG